MRKWGVRNPCDVIVTRGRTSWDAHQTGRIEFSRDDKLVVLPIAYDERSAPYVPGDKTMVSLADEGDCCACAWMERTSSSTVVGIGVDLASPQDFGPRPGTSRFIDLLFSPHERELAPLICEKDLPFSYAVLFGAKEAAFKATARPLRQWYKTHTKPLTYEVRDFGMVEPGLVRGELRHGTAQRALDLMGIRRIKVEYSEVNGLALVVAYALTA